MDREQRLLEKHDACQNKLNVLEGIVDDLKKEVLFDSSTSRTSNSKRGEDVDANGENERSRRIDDQAAEAKALWLEAQQLVYDMEREYSHIGSALTRQRIMKKISVLQQNLNSHEKKLSEVISKLEAKASVKSRKPSHKRYHKNQEGDEELGRKLVNTVERGKQTRQVLDDSWRLIQESRQLMTM